jgi:RND family efflux transporter MFP subunit
MFTAAFVITLMLAGCGPDQSGGKPQAGPPAMPVDVAKPLVKMVTEWDEFTGRFEAVETVELRARVSGYLEAVHFRDGQTVNKGDLLFTIDPRPFQARVAATKAELAVAQTAVRLAKTELSRAEKLIRTNAISKELLDTRRAAKETAEARAEGARANLRTAELDLEFTKIKAPVAGRISDHKIDVGNLVSGGTTSANVLANIVSLDPIYFIFDVSEADYLRYNRLDKTGQRPSSRNTDNPVFVRLMDEEKWTRQGRMNFVDNRIDSNTGTIRGRAIFDNPDGLLVPGIFGHLRVVGSGQYEAMLLPPEAVLSDQNNRIVMTVGDGGAVIPKQVTTGPVIDGLIVIRKGITPNDQVVIKGVQRARPGGKVIAQNAMIADPAAANAPKK